MDNKRFTNPNERPRESIFPTRPQQQQLPIYTCCICHKRERGWGNNSYPIIENGKCCNKCNTLVILARLNRSTEYVMKMKLKGKYR